MFGMRDCGFARSSGIAVGLILGVGAATAMPRNDSVAAAAICNSGRAVFSVAVEIATAAGRSTRPWRPVAPGTCRLMAREPTGFVIGVGVWSAMHGIHSVAEVSVGQGCLPVPPGRAAQAGSGISAGGADETACPSAGQSTPLVARRVLEPGATYVISYEVTEDG